MYGNENKSEVLLMTCVYYYYSKINPEDFQITFILFRTSPLSTTTQYQPLIELEIGLLDYFKMLKIFTE